MIYYIYYHSAYPEQENKKIKEFIKTFHGWAILGPSFYLVAKEVKEHDIDANLIYIRSKLNEYGSANDEFFIGQFGSGATWQGYGIQLKNWLINNSRPVNVDDNNFSLKDRIEGAKNESNVNKLPDTSPIHEKEGL